MFEPLTSIRRFFETESASGFVLIAAAVLALVLANSPLHDAFEHALHAVLSVSVGKFAVSLTAHEWINDGLMAVFFLIVGLEVKREALEGDLSSLRRAALPVIAAFGGSLVPVVICYAFVAGDPQRVAGWAIPAATDIAFALAILSVAGSRLPPTLKIFLTALAVIDDIASVIVITLFYTGTIAWPALLTALGFSALLFAMNRLGVRALTPYLAVGLCLWFCVLESGIHTTLAGIVLAFAIPLRARDGSSPLHALEDRLHPYVAFGIVPLFGLANAGLSFAGLAPSTLLQPLPLGIALGLFVGKQAGVFGFARGAIALRIASFPEGMDDAKLYGLALLAGIGFTMSLFIGGLAFESDALLKETKLGVLAGSLCAGIAGYVVLRAQTK